MRRLKSILTPPATAGRGVRVAALASGMVLLGLAVTGSIALAAQREGTVLLTAQNDEGEAALPASQAAAHAAQDDASSTAQSAARTAARAALSTLSLEQQARFRNPTPVEYREICATGDPGDEGFCSGVLFANLPYRGVPATDFCPPIMPDGEFDIEAVATMGRQNVVALPVQAGETINGVAKAALKSAFPCATASASAARTTITAPQTYGAPPLPGTTRLTIALDYGNRPMILTREDRLRVSLVGADEDGNRFEQASVFELAPGINLPDVTWLDLGRAYFPSGSTNRSYTLTAQIENGEGGPLRYAAEPTTIRLASGSQGRLANLRPEMVLRPVASTTPQ